MTREELREKLCSTLFDTAVQWATEANPIADAILALIDQYEAAKWKPAGEPPSDDRDLVVSSNGRSGWGYWSASSEQWLDQEHNPINPEHYQELPAPPARKEG